MSAPETLTAPTLGDLLDTLAADDWRDDGGGWWVVEAGDGRRWNARERADGTVRAIVIGWTFGRRAPDRGA